MIHEWLLSWHDCWRMAGHLYGWPSHILPWWNNSYQTHQVSTSVNDGIGLTSQVEKMQVCHKGSQISWHDCLAQTSCHGSCQARWDCLLAHIHQTEGCLLLLGFCELLLMFHSWLLQHYSPTHWPCQKEPCLILESHLPKHLQPPKQLFLSYPILHLPNLAAPFTITIDASKFALGAILLQTDTNGEWHPCSYISQSFSPVKWNYDIYDQELLAVIWALKT